MFDGIDADETEDLGRDLDKMRSSMFGHLKKGFSRVAEHFLAEHRLRKLRGRPGIRPQHGQAGLAGSFKYEVGGQTIDTLSMTAFSTSKYARVHEYGATIRARRALYLRFKIGEHWVQTKEVTIPARLGFRDVWKQIGPERDKIISGAVENAFREGI